MASNLLSDRVEAAFPDEQSDEFALFYLGAVLQASRDIGTSLRRTGLLTVALILVTELLLSDKVEEISLLGTKINDVAFARSVIPGVLAYLSYEFMALYLASIDYDDLREHLIRRIRAPVAENRLHPAMSPGVLSFWEVEPWSSSDKTGRAGRARRLLDIATALTLLFGTFLYVLAAYVRVWRLEGAELAVILSSAFAAIIIARAAATFAEDRGR